MKITFIRRFVPNPVPADRSGHYRWCTHPPPALPLVKANKIFFSIHAMDVEKLDCKISCLILLHKGCIANVF